MGIEDDWPLTPEQWNELREPPPKAPWPVIACRNLAKHCPALQRDGIQTDIEEESRTVVVWLGERSYRLTATESGWSSDPVDPEMQLPLENTIRLSRHLHRLLTQDSR